MIWGKIIQKLLIILPQIILPSKIFAFLGVLVVKSFCGENRSCWFWLVSNLCKNLLKKKEIIP